MGFVELRKKIRFPRTHFALIPCGTLLVIISLAYGSLPLLGSWLVREDAVHKADAIAVLSGWFPQRASEAATLYHWGLAPEIWLTHPMGKPDPANLGQPQRPSEDQLNIEVLRKSGVPMRAIHVLSEPIVNTADELNAIDSNLRERGDTTVIIVTNKAHTRRVSTLWEKYHSGVGEALVHAVSLDRFAPSNWWMIASSRAQVIHELPGMINVWARMPVHRPLQPNAPPSGRYGDSARQAGREAQDRRSAEPPSGD